MGEPNEELRNESPGRNRTLGEYKLIKRLGKGTFGEVWLAEHSRGHRFAIKISKVNKKVNRDRAEDATRRDGKFITQLDHPNIVKIIEWKIPEDKTATESGEMYIVMAYVPGGKTLKDLINGTKLDYKHAAEIMLGVCKAVNFAHDQKPAVYHRDLKPENILIAENKHTLSEKTGVDVNRTPKIIDFGLAVLEHEQQRYPKDGSIQYMSPERLRGDQAYAAGDIWAIGVILYEMLSVELPFPADTLSATANRIKNPTDRPKPLREHDPNVPVELVSICEKCLEKETASRYHSVAEIIEPLEQWIASTAEQPIAQQESRWVVAMRSKLLRRVVAAIVCALVVLLAAQWKTDLGTQSELLIPVERRTRSEFALDIENKTEHDITVVFRVRDQGDHELPVKKGATNSISFVPGLKDVRVNKSDDPNLKRDLGELWFEPAPYRLALESNFFDVEEKAGYELSSVDN